MASMTPDFLSKILFWRKDDRSGSNEADGRRKWDKTTDEIRRIIVWDNPVKSLACLVGVNVLFWFIINIKLKFYGLVFIALLVVTVNQLWNEQIHRSMTAVDTDSGRDSATPGSSSSTRFTSEADMNGCVNSGLEMLRSAFLRLKRLRQEHRGLFCAGACISFLMLSFIGRTISCVTLLYILLTAVMIVPGILIRVVPSHVLNSLIQFINSSHKGTESDKVQEEEEDDYIPETNEENLELLRLASDLVISRRDDDEATRDLLLEQITGRTDDTTESSLSKLSFYPESSIPGVDESSLDFIEFEMAGGEKGSQIKKSGDTDDSDSDINFQSKHFNGDTSDEEEFAKGLKFKDVVDKDDKKKSNDSESLPGLLNAASIGLNLLSAGANILTSGKPSPLPAAAEESKRHDRESSSDTDSFELISEEDI